MVKTDKSKEQKPPEIPALDIYQKNGCTLAAFKQALQHGIQTKEKDLAKTFKKQLFQAVGLDRFRIHCQNQTELHALLNLSLALVDKNDDPKQWLELLEQPDYWNAVRLTTIGNLLNKAVARLATHIPKTRNPANEGAPKFNKAPCRDNSAVTAGEASLALATIEGDATLVGARFFFEFVFFLEDKPCSVIALLLNKDAALTAYLLSIGIDETTIKQWQSVVTQLPRQLSPLHAQLLLKDANDEWLSITPMLSVAGASWIGQWRREAYLANGDGTRPLFSIESVEYGGTNARNIASLLMDFSGKQQHPKVLAPQVKRDTNARLERLIHRPSALINPKPLRGKILTALSNPYNELPNPQQTQKLSSLIENLLDDCLEDVTLIRSLLDSEHEEAQAFRNLFNSVPTTHPNLLFVQGEAGEEQIKAIGNAITGKWLGPLQEFKAGADRYNKIKKLIIDQLHAYMMMETSL
jgi:hypothetical protein